MTSRLAPSTGGGIVDDNGPTGEVPGEQPEPARNSVVRNLLEQIERL